ncbi:MAG: T9SS type A sorting domain-containing protein [Bacteroidia bacterium]|nr:T9SS type A sorting domain-containing protein [Bacteroidia bacterium]
MKVRNLIFMALILIGFEASAQLYRPGITLHRNWSISAEQNILGSDQIPPMMNVLCGYSINPLSGKKTGFLSAFNQMTEDTAIYTPYISLNENVLYSVAISDGNATSTTPVVSVGYEEVAIGDRDILINYSDIAGGVQPTKSTNHLIISAPYNQEAKFVKQEMPYSFNFWACGYSELSAGNKDFWFGKIYADGNTSVLWDTTFGGIGEDVITSLTIGDGYALFTGNSSSLSGIDKDIHSTLYSIIQDTIVWDSTFFMPGNQELFGSYNMPGNTIAVGYSDTSVLGNNKDMLIVSFDSYTGDTLWTKTIGSEFNEEAFTVRMANFNVTQCLVVSGYITNLSGDKQNYVVLLDISNGTLISERIFGDDLNDDCIYTMFCMPDGCQHFLFGQQGTAQSFYEIVAYDYDIQVNNNSCTYGYEGSIDLIGGIYGNGYTSGLYDSMHNMVGSVGPYTNLPAGKYYLDISYNFPGAKSGCNITDSVEITEPAPFGVNVYTTDPDCIGNLGQIVIVPHGGSGSYSYSWTGYSGADTLSGLTSGTYEVFVTDGTGCSYTFDYYYATLTDQTLATINGTGITSSGYILENHGKAILYKLGTTGTALELDSITSYTIDLQNLYNFSNVEPGNYKILLQIDSTSYYPNYLNSYYSLNDTVINWDIADTISIACNDNFNLPIKMYEMNAMETGVGSISGHIYLFTYTKQIGEPVPGAEILIEQEPNDVPVQATFTDNSGYYEVNGLEAGGLYSMEVDIPGYPLISSHVNIPITITDTVYEDMNFYIDTTINGGIMADTLQTQIYTFTNEKFELNAYPNPFNSNISFDFNLTKDVFINAEILNVSGEPVKLLLSDKHNKGNVIITWQPQSTLPSGVYFLKLIVDNQVLIKKIVYKK